MNLNSLTAVSPIDGRYHNKTKDLQKFFSEFGLIKYRVLIEIQFFGNCNHYRKDPLHQKSLELK